MRRFSTPLLLGLTLASCSSAGLSRMAQAAAGDIGTDAQIDSAPCFAAAGIGDDDNVIARCGAVIDSEKAARPERLRALLARAGALRRKEQDDPAIADYSAALQLDPTLADILNARGELWRKKGDRPRAVADFAAALKLNPHHEAARANTKALAQELEKIGAQIAVGNRPSFNCAVAKRPVEKAICADPALARLDREIDGASALVLKDADAGQARLLQQQQRDYLRRRSAGFGQPGYDLHKAMQARLRELTGADGY